MIRISCDIFLLLVLFRAGGAAKNDNCTTGDKHKIGNFTCDINNNNEECDYDGGDCCPCTKQASRHRDIVL